MVEEIDVGMKCIKYMLFVSNFMFVMIGFLLISIGSTIRAIYGDFDLFMASHYFSPSILAITIGVVIFFVALFGCVGAIKESTLFINLFGFFLALLLVFEIATAIAAYAMRGDIDHTIRVRMLDSMPDYNRDPYVRDVWDFTQESLRCCGVSTYNEWIFYGPFSTTAMTTVTKDTTGTTVPSSTPIDNEPFNGPSSCCPYNRHKEDETCLKRNTYSYGCGDRLSYVVSESALLLGCGALAVAFIQLLGVIFARMLANAVRRLKTQNMVNRDLAHQRVYEQMTSDFAPEREDNKTPVLYTPTSTDA